MNFDAMYSAVRAREAEGQSARDRMQARCVARRRISKWLWMTGHYRHPEVDCGGASFEAQWARYWTTTAKVIRHHEPRFALPLTPFAEDPAMNLAADVFRRALQGATTEEVADLLNAHFSAIPKRSRWTFREFFGLLIEWFRSDWAGEFEAPTMECRDLQLLGVMAEAPDDWCKGQWLIGATESSKSEVYRRLARLEGLALVEKRKGKGARITRRGRKILE